MGGSMFTVFDAIEIAAEAHRGQFDKGRPEMPYLTHPMRVMSRFAHPLYQMAAVLHDSVEDSDGRVTFESLTEQGCPWSVVVVVKQLTHLPGMSNEEYWDLIRQSRMASAVKLADIDDNTDPARLALLEPEHRERLVKKYAKARAVILGAASREWKESI